MRILIHLYWCCVAGALTVGTLAAFLVCWIGARESQHDLP